MSMIFKVMPRGSARVFNTSIVCGWQFSETRNTPFSLFFVVLKNISIASAVAVASSNRDAFAIGSPVISDTIV